LDSLYVLLLVLAGALIMLLVALLVNNIPRNRRYPEFWL
jgi:CBS-domain-containing membrane protein